MRIYLLENKTWIMVVGTQLPNQSTASEAKNVVKHQKTKTHILRFNGQPSMINSSVFTQSPLGPWASSGSNGITTNYNTQLKVGAVPQAAGAWRRFIWYKQLQILVAKLTKHSTRMQLISRQFVEWINIS